MAELHRSPLSARNTDLNKKPAHFQGCFRIIQAPKARLSLNEFWTAQQTGRSDRVGESAGVPSTVSVARDGN